MTLKLQSYDPATGKFVSSNTKISSQKPQYRGPGHVRTKPMARHLSTSGEQSCDGSGCRNPQEDSSATANRVVDLTGGSHNIVPPPKLCNSQQHHNVEVAIDCEGSEEDTIGLQGESHALISRDGDLPSRQSVGPVVNCSISEQSVTNNDRGLMEKLAPVNSQPTFMEQPNPSTDSSNHTPLSQQDSITQAGASQKFADQSPNQPDTIEGGPNTTQSRRVEPSDETSITFTRTISQETDSSDHHKLLPSAPNKKTNKRIRRGWSTVSTGPNISKRIKSKIVDQNSVHKVHRQARPAKDATDGEELANMDQESSICVSTLTNATSEHIKAAAVVSNMDMEWEIGNLLGKEVIDGVVHYLVAWKPTLVPEHEINAPELIRSFEEKFQVRRT
ncbi:hypothetical protein BGZ63DRAFT_422165 [Mariannaea sp. PMI_226]|nr:hypothetical protein BGZ63DRAFT_422165 [Mariannaea sp. PMI_226]